ncbi:MAG TPA: three-Cys-motif partner protein TcmP [bacterium]|nr:three-Cys-motif partner protein TcmP [bacterium]
MSQEHRFGGDWTEEKLQRLEKYLSAYTNALQNQPFKIAYIDAFAGSGYIKTQQVTDDEFNLFEDLTDVDNRQYLEGSAIRALRVTPPFDSYIFIEKSIQRVQDLEKLKESFPDKKGKIKIVNQDANEFLINLCTKRNWKNHRAVLFLDPYGMQVEWPTIEAIAKTEAIDLWYNFPLGVAVNRMLTKNGQISRDWENKLDRLFGSHDWNEKFYQETAQKELFGKISRIQKVGNFDSIQNYLLDRLKSIFAGVAENPLPLCNSKKNPLYLLCFAVSNRSEKARELAMKFARYILKR